MRLVCGITVPTRYTNVYLVGTVLTYVLLPSQAYVRTFNHMPYSVRYQCTHFTA